MSGAQITDGNGTPQAGAKLYFYRESTTTDLTVWQDAAGTSNHPQPIECEADGFAPIIYIDDTYNYKVVIKTSADVTLKTYDNLPKAVDPTSGVTDSAKPLISWAVQSSATKTITTSELGTGFLCSTSSNSITFTLPSAVSAGNGKMLFFKKTIKDNSVTINTVNSETIDDATSVTMNKIYDYYAIASDGANWHTVVSKYDVGMLLYTSGFTVLAGTAYANGAALSRTTYARLFNEITSTAEGDLSSGSASMTNVTDIPEEVGIGCPLEGTNIPSGTTIANISGTTITMSANATGTATGSSFRYMPHGVGDGSTTFNRPDARDMVPMGRGDMGGSTAGRVTAAVSGLQSNTIGQIGGDQNTQAHNHTAYAQNSAYAVQSGVNASVALHGPTSTTTTGSGNAENIQPSYVCNVLVVLT